MTLSHLRLIRCAKTRQWRNQNPRPHSSLLELLKKPKPPRSATWWKSSHLTSTAEMHWIFSCGIKAIILNRYLNPKSNNKNNIHQASEDTPKQSRKLIREIDVPTTYWFLFHSPWVMFPFPPILKAPTSWARVSAGAEVVKKPSNPLFGGGF